MTTETRDLPRRRLRACVESWPACRTGEYDPRCCRFPKSCSCDVYDQEHVPEEKLEPPPPPRPPPLRPGAADWTVSPEGRSNASEAYLFLVAEVERLIRSGAHSLIAGHAGSVARVIVSQLAHVHGLVPSRPLPTVAPPG